MSTAQIVVLITNTANLAALTAAQIGVLSTANIDALTTDQIESPEHRPESERLNREIRRKP